jgi:hypothetical protein
MQDKLQYKAENKSFKNVEQFKYLGINLKIQNYVHE